MACYFDDKPLGLEFLLNPASKHYCTVCNTSFSAGDELGIYLGHFEQASGKYALLKYIPNPICPNCGNANEFHMLPCEDGQIVELFTKKKVEVEDDV